MCTKTSSTTGAAVVGLTEVSETLKIQIKSVNPFSLSIVWQCLWKTCTYAQLWVFSQMYESHRLNKVGNILMVCTNTTLTAFRMLKCNFDFQK